MTPRTRGSTSSARRSRSPGCSRSCTAIIDGPLDGWGSGRIVGAFAAAVVLLGAFGWWESHSDHPMLNIEFFRNPRFTAASSGLMLIFFAMFGATFLLTQYLQFVMGYTPLRAGTALLPWAAIMLVVAPASARLSERFGTKRVVGVGLSFATLSLALMSTLPVDPHRLRPRRAAPPRPARVRHGPHDGPVDRVDHGITPAGQGRCRLRDERHDPPGRWRARRGGGRQRDDVDLRVAASRRRSPARTSR